MDEPVLLGFVILIDIIEPVSETETGMLYEPTDPISFLYQPERGPKREHENNGTSVSAGRVDWDWDARARLMFSPFAFVLFFRHNTLLFIV